MARRLVGYAVRWNSLSQDLGGFRELFARGAFAKVLRNKEQDPLALLEHDARLLLGRRSARTLSLTEDEQGLKYEVDLLETSVARDVWEQVSAGNIFQSSFSFSVAPDGDDWALARDGSLLRTVKEVSRLYDVSPVSQPAYLSTSVQARGEDGEAIVAWPAELELHRMRLRLASDDMPLQAQQEIDRLRVGLMGR